MRLVLAALALLIATPVLARPQCERLIVGDIPAERFVVAKMMAFEVLKARDERRYRDVQRNVYGLAELFHDYPNAAQFGLCEADINPASFWDSLAKFRAVDAKRYTQETKPVYGDQVPVPALPRSGGFSCITADILTTCRPD